MKHSFICTECNAEYAKWLGRCSVCDTWNSIKEQVIEADTAKPYHAPSTLQSIDTRTEQPLPTGNKEFDRILGGGIYPGASFLISGDPGIGKSTLMLQIAASMSDTVLYVSGEETLTQISIRAQRLGITNNKVQFLAETELSHILNAIDALRPALIIIDSIQTVQSAGLSGAIGNVSQIRNAVHELISMARTHNASMIFLAHITKDRDIAGPKLLEHIVDTVLFLEQGEADIRVLRIIKNRNGNCDEMGLFTMQADGLQTIEDPSSVFLNRRSGAPPPGIVVTPIYEGSRVFLVEIQALSTAGNVMSSRVYSDRIDARRVSRIAAVLEKHTAVRLSDKDIYTNVAGGIRINDVAIDAALALALYSTHTNQPVPADTVVTGEISLAGEIRPVLWLQQRMRACQEMKFHTCIVPEQNKLQHMDDVKILPVSTLQDVLRAVFHSKTTTREKQ